MDRRTAKGVTAAIASAIMALPAVAGAEPPKADGAAFGPFYDLGVPPEATWSGGWNVLHTGDEWDIGGPTNATQDGPRWWVDWDVCGVGANIVQVRWSAGRTAASTSPRHAFRVTDGGASIFATSGNLRDDLIGAINPGRRTYLVGTSSCHAQLRIDQVGGAGAEPSKRYWVTSPRAIAQDTQPPSVAITDLPSAWLPAGTTTVPISWSTDDNFGGSGIGNQHVSIDGVGEFAAGWFRQLGPHASNLNLAGLADGIYTARVHVDGDGTDGADAVGTLHLDRTPPRANLSVIPTAPGLARADINVDDFAGGAGTRLWTVTAPDDAPIANQATVDHLANIDLRRFDGQDVTLHLTSIDGADNAAYGHSQLVRVDATAPTVGALGPAGWVAGLTSGTPLALDLGDNRADGIGEVAVSINTATDGSGSGQELPLTSRGATPRGALNLSAPLPVGIGDGVHRITAVARDPEFPAQLAGRGETTVHLDTTSPTLGDPSGWSLSAGSGSKYTMTLPGLSDSASGINSVRVLANSDTGGGRLTSLFKPVGSAPAAQGQGPASVSVDLTGFREGRHATIVQVADAAGNVSEAPGPTIVFDHTAPTVTATVANGLSPRVSWTQTDAIGFGSCLTTVEIQGASTNVAWQSVAEMAGSTVPAAGASAEIPMQGLKAGDYRVRVTACDAAGNKASATAKLAWAPDGAPGAGAAGAAKGDASTQRYRLTELWITSPGAPRAKVTETNAAKRRLGQRIRIEGALEQVNGKRSATPVTLYDSAGTQVATATSDASGRFFLNATIRRGGTWRLTAQHGDQVLGHVKLRVPAGLVQQVNTHRLHLGDTLVVTGRLTPGALAASKLLQLQWRDGRSWRPIANVTADKFGAFNVSYRFRRAAGYAVQMRIAVPAERGWPFEPVNGKPFSVEVM